MENAKEQAQLDHDLAAKNYYEAVNQHERAQDLALQVEALTERNVTLSEQNRQQAEAMSRTVMFSVNPPVILTEGSATTITEQSETIARLRGRLSDARGLLGRARNVFGFNTYGNRPPSQQNVFDDIEKFLSD
jgi:hypothetical protein